MELLSTSCTVHHNQGFTSNNSETKCPLIILETSCKKKKKKAAYAKWKCATEFQVQQLPQTLVRNPLHSSTPSSAEDWLLLYSHHLNCVNEHMPQKWQDETMTACHCTSEILCSEATSQKDRHTLLIIFQRH